MATNTVRLQNIFDGANDFATPTADIDSVMADVVLFAEDKEFADFYLPKVVTKDTATPNEKRAWLLFKFNQTINGWKRHARRTRREITRAAEDAADV